MSMRLVFALAVAAWPFFNCPVLAENDLEVVAPASLPRMFDRVVVPGVRLGPLELGASEGRVLEMLGQPESMESPFPGTRLLAWRNLGLDVAFVRDLAVRIRAIGPEWRCGDLTLGSSLAAWTERFPELKDTRGLVMSPALGLCLEADTGESVARALWVMAPSGNWDRFKQDSSRDER